jgi:hypothetical protein
MRTSFYLGLFLWLSILGCSHRSGPSALINNEASVAGDLPYNPLDWNVISARVNHRNGTMALLLGNELAVRHSRETADRAYPPGSILSLVTWSLQADNHWFGARIPGGVKSVEFVTVKSVNGPSLSYEEYRGSPLKKVVSTAGTADSRIEYIVDQRASRMP